ncbi:unnamed protein product [Didymodactylos carnosus]|uniref:Uncharacterized protein n=1 Tax=Didymodactylos carnosus TaxID=1234261 RepID=A0A8S2T832_9BILA|nr:unnamed protein product [Didymodactylos carnosus]CAF4275360.1 unnamed protein product [Didymodactylos carnosus]
MFNPQSSTSFFILFIEIDQLQINLTCTLLNNEKINETINEKNNENFKNVYLLSVWKTGEKNFFHSISNEQFIDRMINKQQRLSCLDLNSYKLGSMSSLKKLVKKQSQQNKSMLTIENFYFKSSTITDHPQSLKNVSFTSVKIDSTIIISTTTLSSVRVIREEEENDQSILPAFFLFLFNASKSILPTSLRTPPRRLLIQDIFLLKVDSLNVLIFGLQNSAKQFGSRKKYFD